MIFNVTTGYGYGIDGSGHCIIKYARFIPGPTTFPDGLTITEVADEASMNGQALYEPPANTQARLTFWLNGRYEVIRDKIAKAYAAAQLEGNAAQVTALQTAWTDTKAKYASKLAAINAGATSVPDDFVL